MGFFRNLRNIFPSRAKTFSVRHGKFTESSQLKSLNCFVSCINKKRTLSLSQMSRVKLASTMPWRGRVGKIQRFLCFMRLIFFHAPVAKFLCFFITPTISFEEYFGELNTIKVFHIIDGYAWRRDDVTFAIFIFYVKERRRATNTIL